MNRNKSIVLFVNDSYFSYLSAKSLIECNHNKIGLIIFSVGIISSWKKIISIYKKTSKRYFFYRIFVQILSKTIYRKKSIKFLATKYNVAKCYIRNINELEGKVDKNIVAIAFNFDLIIKKEVIEKFEKGIFNIHASKLPRDKGISPVLWAFARGDNEIWSTIYQLDEGIDSGPIAEQFQIKVQPNDTSFSLYKRVCTESGSVLQKILNQILKNEIKLKEQPEKVESNYFSWPDKQFQSMMNKSNRKFFSIKDLFTKN